MKTLKVELSKWAKKNHVAIPAKKKRRKKKPKKASETFSRREIEELMGMRQPTYSRGRGGAIRQK